MSSHTWLASFFDRCDQFYELHAGRSFCALLKIVTFSCMIDFELIVMLVVTEKVRPGIMSPI